MFFSVAYVVEPYKELVTAKETTALRIAFDLESSLYKIDHPALLTLDVNSICRYVNHKRLPSSEFVILSGSFFPTTEFAVTGLSLFITSKASQFLLVAYLTCWTLS